MFYAAFMHVAVCSCQFLACVKHVLPVTVISVLLISELT